MYNFSIMLKYLAILTMFIALLLGGPGMAENQQSAAHAATSKPAANSPPVPPTHVVIDPPLPPSASPQKPSDSQSQSPEKPLPRFERPEWVIVYITALYALIAWWTLRAIKRQADTMDNTAKEARESSAQATGIAKEAADAAKKSADAALLNAKALINSERAWMFIELSIPTDVAGTKTIYDISCVNRGKTPARITDCRIGHCFVDDPENLSLTATDYHPAVMPFPTVKASDNGFRADRVHPGAKWTERKPGDEFLMYFGYVLYEDIFPTGKNGELGKHETWWCFAYLPYGDSLTPSGPDRYTKNT